MFALIMSAILRFINTYQQKYKIIVDLHDQTILNSLPKEVKEAICLATFLRICVEYYVFFRFVSYFLVSLFFIYLNDNFLLDALKKLCVHLNKTTKNKTKKLKNWYESESFFNKFVLNFLNL